VDRPQIARESPADWQNGDFVRSVVYCAERGGKAVAHLALALLGPFQATLGGLGPVQGLNSDYLRALLAYLAVERGRGHPREALASLLWPERTEREAVSALRHALANLRGALGDRRSPGDHQASSPILLVSRSSVQLNPAGDYWLDVAEFERLAGQDLTGSGRGDPGVGRGNPAPTDLTAAVELYRGPFLHGLSVADSLAFDEWMLFKGEEFRRRVLSLLEQLTSLQLAHGATAEAARWARRQLELEPYREVAHRQLMAALTLGGERPAALAQYEACRRLLAEELGCEPGDETQALYAQIRAGTLALSVPPSLAVPAPVPSEREGSVPPPRFVAREQELARLGSLLDRALAGRGGVALVAGEAGSGKTALLEEFARRAGLAHGDLIALRGSCNAHGGAGDPYLPFRELLQTLAGDVEGKRAGGTLSPEQARRAWETLPAVGAALVQHGPDLIDTFVPGEALLQRVEGFRAPAAAARPPAGQAWQGRLRELVRRGQEGAPPAPQADLFAQVTAVLRAVSACRPLLLAIDDLQWSDAGTAALLFHLGRHLTGSRILLVCAYRPEALQASPDLRGREPAVPQDLGGLGSVLQELTREWGDVLVDLDRADGWAFVEAYVDSEPNRLEEDFRRALYGHTEGNALFTVELLRSFERRGALVREEAGQWIEAPGLDWEHVPARVEAVIAGHLGGLPDEDRALLGAASVQGDKFAAEVVARVLGLDEEAALRRLSGPLRTRHRLVDAVSLDRVPSSGQRLSNYRFRHLLVQRSAYDALDAVERARLHEATGRALEAIYAPPAGAPLPGAQEEQPAGLAAELAWHYESAGMALEAARALHDAGREAMRLAAFRRALDRFDHGLALLAAEPPSPQRAEIERLLEVARLGPQRNLGGSGSPRLAGALARAAEAGAGDAQGRARLAMLSAEASLLTSTGRLEEALPVAERMLDAANQWGEDAIVAHAHWRVGLIHHLTGYLQEAERHFDWVLAWLTPERGAELRAALGYDVTAHTLAFSAMDQWLFGYPEKALALSTQAVTGALEHGDLFGQACASAVGTTVLFLLRSERTAVQERSELCYRLCLQQGFASWQAYAKVFLGWLAVVRGDSDVDAGIERMRSAIAGWQSTGMIIGADRLVVVLADGCLEAARRCRAGEAALRTGRLAVALAAIEPLLGPSAPCGQSFQAELLRMRGELLLERDGLAAAEEALACFEQAMQIGREQGALAWELRAAMSLVRLHERQGEAFAAELAEARQCLHEVYGRFTEGFAFPDLQEAAALIGEIG
jgi:DNA-binding SARP family transcriptional activator/tetratricopeptide (TPR) repeat protein